MNSNLGARRELLLQLGALAGAGWFEARWPAVLSAPQHAHEAAKGAGAPAFEVLTPGQAKQIEAIASQIIPTDDLPGAREAGVVYFIDRALKTFAKDTLPIYKAGLADLNRATTEAHPGVNTFADATAEQQEKLLGELTSEEAKTATTRRRPPV